MCIYKRYENFSTLHFKSDLYCYEDDILCLSVCVCVCEIKSQSLNIDNNLWYHKVESLNITPDYERR